MMIAPRHATGPSVLDLVSQTTQLWGQMLLAPSAWGQSLLPAPPQPVAQPAAAAELTALAQAEQPVTDHALLVLLGRFAQHLGLVRLLEAVPLVQKTVTHSSQAKLIEFLLAVPAGLGQLQELFHAANPIASDTLLAQAWGQKLFADYSGVSRTLAVADADTLLAVRELLALVSRPFIDREVMAILRYRVARVQRPGGALAPLSPGWPRRSSVWLCRGRLAPGQSRQQSWMERARQFSPARLSCLTARAWHVSCSATRLLSAARHPPRSVNNPGASAGGFLAAPRGSTAPHVFRWGTADPSGFARVSVSPIRSTLLH